MPLLLLGAAFALGFANCFLSQQSLIITITHCNTYHWISGARCSSIFKPHIYLHCKYIYTMYRYTHSWGIFSSTDQGLQSVVFSGAAPVHSSVRVDIFTQQYILHYIFIYSIRVYIHTQLGHIYLGCKSCIFWGCSGPFSSQSRLVLCATPRAQSLQPPNVSQLHIHSSLSCSYPCKNICRFG